MYVPRGRRRARGNDELLLLGVHLLDGVVVRQAVGVGDDDLGTVGGGSGRGLEGDVEHLEAGAGVDDGLPGHGPDADELAVLVDEAVDGDGDALGVDGGELGEDLARELDAFLWGGG